MINNTEGNVFCEKCKRGLCEIKCSLLLFTWTANIAELCKKANIDNIVFDKGAYNYNGRVKALADACREFGLKF